MTIASRTENSRSLETVEVGQTSLRVPKLGFGTVALGLLSDDEEEIGRKAIEEAYSRGLTFFDTAPSYGHVAPRGGWVKRSKASSGQPSW